MGLSVKSTECDTVYHKVPLECFCCYLNQHKESMMCAHAHTLNTLLQIAIPYICPSILFKPRAENILCGVHCVSVQKIKG